MIATVHGTVRQRVGLQRNLLRIVHINRLEKGYIVYRLLIATLALTLGACSVTPLEVSEKEAEARRLQAETLARQQRDLAVSQRQLLARESALRARENEIATAAVHPKHANTDHPKHTPAPTSQSSSDAQAQSKAAVSAQVFPLKNDALYRDKTLTQPNIYFEVTPESRSVIVGSGTNARINGCTLMQRYRVNTNADFTASMNLMRYRSALMGARWVSIVHHGEIDVLEGSSQIGENVIYLRDGTDLGSSRFLTTIVADIFDCPCDTKSCAK